MSTRDELADLIEDAVDYAIYNGADAPPSLAGIVAHYAAAAVLAEGYRKPRTVTTEKELAWLRDGAVILSEQGGIFQQFNGYWLEPANSYGHRLNEISLPATVLHEPEATK